MRSLIHLCHDVDLAALPGREHRNRRTEAWPVGLLPAAAIAADLAREGLRVRGARVLDRSGHTLTIDALGDRLADVLETAAAILPDPHLRQLREEAEAVRRHRDPRPWIDEHDEIPAVREAYPHLLDYLRARDTGEHLTEWVREALAHPSPEDVAEDTEAEYHRRRGIRWSLEATARDLRISRAARQRLGAAVRPHLPEESVALDPLDAPPPWETEVERLIRESRARREALDALENGTAPAPAPPEAPGPPGPALVPDDGEPGPPDAPDPDDGEPAALDWLATLDGEDAIRRSALPGRYADAGSPGNLDAATLRRLAADRWPTRTVRGHMTFRPPLRRT